MSIFLGVVLAVLAVAIVACYRLKASRGAKGAGGSPSPRAPGAPPSPLCASSGPDPCTPPSYTGTATVAGVQDVSGLSSLNGNYSRATPPNWAQLGVTPAKGQIIQVLFQFEGLNALVLTLQPDLKTLQWKIVPFQIDKNGRRVFQGGLLGPTMHSAATDPKKFPATVSVEGKVVARGDGKFSGW